MDSWELTKRLMIWAYRTTWGKSRGIKWEDLPNKEFYLSVWKVKHKMIGEFRPKQGETDVIIHPWSGERSSDPSREVITLLTQEEIRLLDLDDPVLNLFANGWRLAFKEIELYFPL